MKFLKSALKEETELNLEFVLVSQILEHMMLLIKEMDYWEYKDDPKLAYLLKNKFNQYKEFILSDDF